MEPKILHTIFQFLDRASNSRNSKVCRAWGSVATALVWYTVDFRVVRCLAELAVNDDGVLVGSQCVELVNSVDCGFSSFVVLAAPSHRRRLG